jgi:pyruvate/2-oxoglutarate dehydrogenase complex dihydrolipoamide dehydrogenase (E3) component
MSTSFDAVIIGTGQSGPALAHALAATGRSVAIIERRDFGGSCVNHGCIPTKTLVASARAAHVARRAADYGVSVGDVRVDLKAVKARKDAIVRESTTGVEKALRDNDRITVIEGHGRLSGPGEVRVGDRMLKAGLIVLNVGARARRPEIPGLTDVPYLTSTGMLELDDLPDQLAIVGGGYIGLEFGQMFRRFGSEVTIIQRGPVLLPREDPDFSEAVREVLEGEGVRVLTGTEPAGVKSGVRLQLTGAHKQDLTCSHLLVAVGRVPNTDDLGLAQAGVERDERGYITVDEQLRTNVEGIYAIGDCNGRGAFTHTSYNDFEILRDHLLGEGRRRLSDRVFAHAVYMDPPLARVGLTEREVRERGRPALIATMPMKRVGRARERGETQGFMKVLVDKQSERILGAAILGINGDEAVHTFLDVMYADAPYTVLRDAVHIHPTVSELIPTLLEGLEPLE